MKKSKIKKGVSNPKSVIKFLNGKISDEIYFYRFEDLDIGNLSLEYYDKSVEVLEDRFEKINGRVRGEAYSKGTISKEDAEQLKGIITHIGPKNVVETGVCNGTSTLAILEGLNGLEGKLYSIDLPETPESDEEDFWKGKGGSVVPPEKEPGWIIPEKLRGNWELILGNSLYELPELLERLDKVDIFIHDSEHSYEMMMFEFCLAWKHLSEGGYLICDDHDWNNAFHDFAKEKNLTKYRLGSLGLLQK